MNTARVIERRLRSHRLSAPAAHDRRGGRAHARHAGAGVLGRPVGARRAHEGRSERARRRRGLRPRRDRPLVDDARHDPRHPRARPRLGARRDRRAAAPRGRRRAPRRGRSTRAELGEGRAPDAARAAPAATGSPARSCSPCSRQGGVSTARQRGYHLLVALSLRALVCQGPVVPRESGPTREQYIVRTDEWVTDAASPADPLAEFFVRYIASHGPAGARDFAWWSGLPLGVVPRGGGRGIRSPDRRLATTASRSTSPPARRRGAAARRHDVLALPPLRGVLPLVRRPHGAVRAGVPRADRSEHERHRPAASSSPAARSSGSGRTRSRSAGTRMRPVPELFAPGAATDAEIGAALDRYRAFITG